MAFTNFTKVYKSLDVANKLATQHSLNVVEAAGGGYHVQPDGFVMPVVKPAAPVAAAPAAATTAAPATDTPPAPVAPISVFFGGARAKDVYVITAPCGKGDKERWFHKDRLISVVSETKDGVAGVTITALPKEFTSRGIAVS